MHHVSISFSGWVISTKNKLKAFTFHYRFWIDNIFFSLWRFLKTICVYSSYKYTPNFIFGVGLTRTWPAYMACWKSSQKYECYLRGSNRALSCRALYTKAVIVKNANTFFQRAFRTSANKYYIWISPVTLFFGVKYLNNKSRIVS